ncbi:hypothetical protein BG015_002568 [Linnemannia schmuckeri]|uniref:C2H2-type domain-containing protein n=1 Tax=Linnemannia schmuckeri TaxID=64567 RepID=A0A9P5RRT9_9FUNG|nr:hypothetical protein BG015_002568 [Linnemannia schmuckeri]
MSARNYTWPQTHGSARSSDHNPEAAGASSSSGPSSHGQSDAPSGQCNPIVTSEGFISYSVSSSAPVLQGTYTEVSSSFAFTRGGHHKAHTMTTVSVNCYWTSRNKWTANREVNAKPRRHDIQHDDPHPHPLVTIYKATLESIESDPRPPFQHDASSIQAALDRAQPVLNEQLRAVSESDGVHLVCDFVFYGHRTYDDKPVEVLISIEFYQAPWRTRTKLWNWRGSLIITTGPWYEATGRKDTHAFDEFFPIAPLPFSFHLPPPQGTPAASSNALQQPTILYEAFWGPRAVLFHTVQSTVIAHSVPDSAGKNSLVGSSPVASPVASSDPKGSGSYLGSDTDSIPPTDDSSSSIDNDGGGSPSVDNDGEGSPSSVPSGFDAWWSHLDPWSKEILHSLITSSPSQVESLSSLFDQRVTQPSQTEAPLSSACVSPKRALLPSVVLRRASGLSDETDSTADDSLFLNDAWRSYNNDSVGGHLGANPQAKPIVTTDGSGFTASMQPVAFTQPTRTMLRPDACHSLNQTQSFVNPAELTKRVASVSSPDATDADATDTDDGDDATDIIDDKDSSSKSKDTDGDDDPSDASIDTPDGDDSSSKSMDTDGYDDFSSESKATDSDDHSSSEPMNSDTEEEVHNHPLPNVIEAIDQEPVVDYYGICPETEPNATGTGNNNDKSSPTSTSNCQDHALPVLSTIQTRTTNTKPAEITKLKSGRKAVTKRPATFPCPVRDCTEEPYTTRYSLESHMNSTHGDYAYQCDFCIKVYSRYGDCTRHEDSEHRGKKWRCKCLKAYTRKPSGKQREGCKNGRKHFFKIVFLNPEPCPLLVPNVNS